MSAIFTPPKIPAPAAAPAATQTAFAAPPQRNALSVQDATASDRMRRAAMRGRGATLLTANDDRPAGDRRKTLLGE
jgi:hypothetical protein